MIDPDNPDPKIYGLQIGVVTHRDDPEGLGRVRARVPGLLEPASAWAYPLGAPGGGSGDRGTWWIPELGAEVGILFKDGDPDVPFYLPANWGRGEPPAAGGGDPDVRVLALGAYDLVVDSRPGSKALRIVDKADGENLIELDGGTRILTVSAKTAVRILSTGQVEIDGLLVTVGGVPAGSGRL